MSNNKPGSPGKVREAISKLPKKKLRAGLSVTLAVLLALSTVISLFGQSEQAYAGTTGSDSSYYQLYDSNSNYSNISHLRVDGNSAFCVEFNSEFSNGAYVSKHNAVDVYGQATVTRFALYQDYIYSISWLSDTQRYFIAQSLVWDTLEGGFPGGLRVNMGVSDQNQINIKNEAIAYYNQYKNSYVGGGTFWDAGNHQNLAEFWIDRHTLGSINLKKESSNPEATNNNPRYSLAGAIYTIYNSSGAAVGTLTIDANSDSNTVSNLWAGEYGHYTVKETKAPPGYKQNTTVYSVNLTSDGQTITVSAKDEPVLGKIELTKTSANPNISEGNDCYRLNGAQFGVYRTEADAKAQVGRYATITTNNAGFGTAENLPLGEYWVREFKAPEGYALDNTIHWVDITTAKTTVQVNAKNLPKNDPVGILLQKADADTGLPYAGSDAASLAGAQFTIKYYDAQHATVSAAQADTPTRTWVLRTDAEGYALLDEGYRVAGDALYLNSGLDATIPIGTFTIQETKAPTGYLLSTAQIPNSIRLFHITDDGTDSEFVYVYNMPEFREQIVRGDVVLVKYQEDGITTPDLPSELKTPEVGTTFDLYASRDFSGITPKDGAAPAFSITTDEDGVASTIATGQVLLQWPDGSYSTRPRTHSDSGCLPYDTYLVIQRDAPYGYSPANRFTVKVTEDKKTHTYIVGNTLTPAAIRIEKVDSETGVAVPYPSKWQVLNAESSEPISMTIYYPKTQAIDTFQSDDNGWLLLPEMLPMGSYLLHEVEAPASGTIGYLINPVDVAFAVSERYEWDDPLVVTCADAPAKGQVSLIKYDELDGSRVEGATYGIFAAADIYTLDDTLRYEDGEQVDTLTTDNNGEALSKELYLGSYVVREITTPNGFALNQEMYSVELAYKGQTVSVNIEDVYASDIPTTLDILKVDSATGEPLGGVVFAIEDAEGEVVELATAEDGHALYPYLLQGSYKVYELSTIPGYILSNEVQEVVVDEDGLINGQAVFELVFANDFTKVEISKTDIVTGEPVEGALLQVFPVDDEGNIADEPIAAWTTTNEPHLIERLLQGDYILREIIAPPGYVLAQDVPFTVEDTGDIQPVVMVDDITKVEITKTDIVTGEPVVGAVLQIFPVGEGGNIADEPLYEWESTEDAYYIERLLQGDYILREITAPAGFVVARDIEFTVEDTGEIQLVEMQDDFTKLEILKVDADTGKLVAGATLQLIGADGEVLYGWVSTDKPYLIERIPQGSYTLHEVKAPVGYELAEDIVFTVNDTATAQRISMADKPLPTPDKLDQTGRDGSIPFAAVGILILIALGGTLFAIKHLRKKNEETNNSDASDESDSE